MIPLFIAVSVALPIPAGAASLPLSALTLHLSDLRAGYVSSGNQVRTPASIARQDPLLRQLLLAHGWIDGYDTRYERAANPRVQIGMLADQFRNVAGARWWLAASLLRVPTGYRMINLPPVGEESTAIENSAFAGVIFRRGAIVIDVYVSLQAPSPLSSVVALGRVVDARLARAAGVAPAPPVSHNDRTRSMRIWVRQRIFPAGTQVTLYVSAAPGARCASLVTGSERHGSVPFRGYPWLIGKSGIAFWQWTAASTATRDTATVTCVYQGKTTSARMSFGLKRASAKH